MTLLVALSMVLGGVSIALLCGFILRRQQHKAQRDTIKARLLEHETDPHNKRSYSRIPLVGGIANKQEQERRAHMLEAELPRMLDILAMGMHAGLGFDAAFGLYVHRFDTALARHCRESFELWEKGLISRSLGLEQLAAELQLPLFDRFSRTAIRSIRHGIAMAPLIKEYADQARKEYRNKQKEKVFKAPVKMLLPTGGLILPAMMMLVIGPILLDVTGRMM